MITGKGKPNFSEKNVSQSIFVQNKSSWTTLD